MRTYEIVALALCCGALALSFRALRSDGVGDEIHLAIMPNSVPLDRIKLLGATLVKGDARDDVFEALDYQCPPCHAQEESGKRFRAHHPHVTWHVLQFPLQMHNHAYELALLALQAERGGRFPEFHRAAMSRLIRPQEDVGRFVASMNADFSTLDRSDLREDKAFRARIDRIRHLPITGTPTFFAYRSDGRSGILHSAADLDRFFDK